MKPAVSGDGWLIIPRQSRVLYSRTLWPMMCCQQRIAQHLRKICGCHLAQAMNKKQDDIRSNVAFQDIRIGEIDYTSSFTAQFGQRLDKMEEMLTDNRIYYGKK